MPGAVALPHPPAGLRSNNGGHPTQNGKGWQGSCFFYNPQGLKYSPKSNRESKRKTSAKVAPVWEAMGRLGEKGEPLTRAKDGVFLQVDR